MARSQTLTSEPSRLPAATHRPSGLRATELMPGWSPNRAVSAGRSTSNTRACWFGRSPTTSKSSVAAQARHDTSRSGRTDPASGGGRHGGCRSPPSGPGPDRPAAEAGRAIGDQAAVPGVEQGGPAEAQGQVGHLAGGRPGPRSGRRPARPRRGDGPRGLKATLTLPGGPSSGGGVRGPIGVQQAIGVAAGHLPDADHRGVEEGQPRAVGAEAQGNARGGDQGWPVAGSQSRVVPSKLADARRLSEGWKATKTTGALWPFRTARGRYVAASQRWI